MTDYLADTNVIFRWAMPNETGHALCRLAIRRLYRQNARIYVTGQVLMETWAVMTRPQTANGLGLPTTEAVAVIRRIRRGFPLLGGNCRSVCCLAETCHSLWNCWATGL